jgi:glutamine phosphoribosylpyrophosphate amidotransferase
VCGIIGITGRDDAVDGIVAGLTRLEYRGYDSAGIVANDGRDLRVVKRAGKLAALRQALEAQPLSTSTGIGHTRWATHGEPNDRNAHPHVDPSGRVAVVHNGIIENYQALRAGSTTHGSRPTRTRRSPPTSSRASSTRQPEGEPTCWRRSARSSRGSTVPTRCASSPPTSRTPSSWPSTRHR